MISGIHGSAWISVVKDIMILGIVLYLGIYLPIHYYGGFTEMFKQIDAAKPGFLAAGNRTERFLVQLNGFADRSRLLYVHTFAASYSAEHPRVFRKNAIIMPLYQLVLLFVIFTGFAAILQVPGLKGADTDLALLKLSVKTFDPWFVELIGSAGILTALVPGSMILTKHAVRQKCVQSHSARHD